MSKKDKVRFTVKWLDGLKATGEPYAIGDATCKGLRIKVSAHGVKVFYFSYRSRVTGKPRDHRIGEYGPVKLEQAHKRVNEVLRPLVEGNPPRDPQEEKIEAREERKGESERPFEKLAPLFVKDHLAGQRSRDQRERQLFRVGHAFGWLKRDLGTITADEGKAWLKRLVAKDCQNKKGRAIGGPTEAFTAKSLLNMFWDWAEENGHIGANIFRGMVVPGTCSGKARDRKLTDHEIRTLWSECEHPEEFGYTRDTASALRLILCILARTSMSSGLLNHELIDIDEPQPKLNLHRRHGLRVVNDGDLLDDDQEVDTNGPRLELPFDRMKGKNTHVRPTFVVPLSPRAVAVIKSGTGYGKSGAVFKKAKTGTCGRPGEQLPREEVAAFMAAIWAKHQFKHATPRDLRRTATQLITSTRLRYRNQITTHEVGYVLNHSRGGSVTGIHYDNANPNPYDRYDEKCEMIAILTARLDRIFGDTARPAIAHVAA